MYSTAFVANNYTSVLGMQYTDLTLHLVANNYTSVLGMQYTDLTLHLVANNYTSVLGMQYTDLTLHLVANNYTSVLAGAYEPPKAARRSNYVERHLHLRAFSAYRIRTDLDYGEYPLW